MSKRILFWISVFTVMGCASVTIPNYIRDEHPYHKKFYAPFDTVLEAAVHALEDSGWQVTKRTDPSVFERNKDAGTSGVQQILLFTDVRQMPLFVGTRYARMNIYLQSTAENTTEIELRYLTITSVSLKNFQNYRNDRFAEKFFARIETLLK